MSSGPANCEPDPGSAVVLLATKANAGKMKSSDLESGQPGGKRGEQSRMPGTEGCDGTADYSGYLPPTKALNMQYKPRHKQTN
ncbi:hypothetical protein EYF80_005554 [Liparis tanakae]|uniref:Uncharacterized protein n=1 Tax=Liparis tanakae TaxID=230148 RepID=A0A4Z2J2J3_9TELE|nr:hypothetical protein EYF80_005554 [Liparis tanakae]